MDSRDNLWQRANQAMPYFAAVAAILIVGATAIAMLCGIAIDPPPGESCMQCAREWIGSLSGWGAVGAALVTVLAIKRQITQSHLLSEQSRLSELSNFAEERGDALARVAVAMKYIANSSKRLALQNRDESITNAHELAGYNQATLHNIKGARGLKAIKVREQFLIRANIDNAQTVIDDVELLDFLVASGSKSAVAATALALEESCRTIAEAINCAAVHQTELAHTAQIELDHVRRRLEKISSS